MRWDEILAKLKLVDFSAKVEGEQVGLVNVHVENKTDNHTYNITFSDPRTAEAFVAGFRVPANFEELVKAEAERRLSALGISPDRLSEATRTEISTLTIASSASHVVQDSGHGTERVFVVKIPDAKKGSDS